MRALFSRHILCLKPKAHLALTKGYSRLSPDAAKLFVLFGCTHPPPPVPPSLSAHAEPICPKDIAGCDIMKLKVS